ncbi:hypothetical protein GPX89_07640 [Nocardia sp. ET3-3]|uniref:Uncharacterized protein n=1 Tax=Nocardia terrae TaxID=2675851 RepID=A0A7K1USH5_9NOCA|nr:hypothetical protein [Nocardia terrae]MVU77119.1 hypothetical protein [Nocardia terrae]
MKRNPAPSAPVATAPGPIALAMVYLAKNFTTGAAFVIYGPAPDTAGAVYTVAHISATATGTAAPIVCQVPRDDLAGYAAGAVRILRTRHPDTEVIVCTNTAPWPLSAALPR